MGNIKNAVVIKIWNDDNKYKEITGRFFADAKEKTLWDMEVWFKQVKGLSLNLRERRIIFEFLDLIEYILIMILNFWFEKIL